MSNISQEMYSINSLPHLILFNVLEWMVFTLWIAEFLWYGIFIVGWTPLDIWTGSLMLHVRNWINMTKVLRRWCIACTEQYGGSKLGWYWKSELLKELVIGVWDCVQIKTLKICVWLVQSKVTGTINPTTYPRGELWGHTAVLTFIHSTCHIDLHNRAMATSLL